MSTIRWIIGAGETQKFIADVMAHSIRTNASREVEIIHTYDKARPTYKGYPDPPAYDDRNLDTTPFAYVRVWAPELMERQGRVIVTDCDMLVLGDAAEIWDQDMGDKWVMKCRCTGVLMVDCERCAHWDVAEAFAKMDKREWNYGHVVQGLCQTPKDKIGEIKGHWNDPDRLTDETKLLHYTSRMRQPWDFPGIHPHEDFWVKWAVRAITEGDANVDDARGLPLWPTIEKALGAHS